MTEFILNAIAQGGYIGIFLLMALENVVPPIPSEVIMGLGGMAVARGDMAISGMCSGKNCRAWSALRPWTVLR